MSKKADILSLCSKEQLIDMYISNNLTCQEIGKRLGGYNASNIAHCLHKLGIKLRRRGYLRGRLTDMYHGYNLRDLYVNKRMSTAEIAQLIGVVRTSLVGAMRNRRIPARGNGQRGAESHNWKGGRINCDGYIDIYCPSHPRAHKGYVREHILVWEKSHGIQLPKYWIIHHLNGVKNDNRSENLLGMSSSKHSKVIPAIQARILLLEQEIMNLERELGESR